MEIDGVNYRYVAKDRNGVLVAAAHTIARLCDALDRDGYQMTARINDGAIHHKAWLVELIEG